MPAGRVESPAESSLLTTIESVRWELFGDASTPHANDDLLLRMMSEASDIISGLLLRRPERGLWKEVVVGNGRERLPLYHRPVAEITDVRLLGGSTAADLDNFTIEQPDDGIIRWTSGFDPSERYEVTYRGGWFLPSEYDTSGIVSITAPDTITTTGTYPAHVAARDNASTVALGDFVELAGWTSNSGKVRVLTKTDTVLTVDATLTTEGAASGKGLLWNTLPGAIQRAALILTTHLYLDRGRNSIYSKVKTPAGQELTYGADVRDRILKLIAPWGYPGSAAAGLQAEGGAPMGGVFPVARV